MRKIEVVEYNPAWAAEFEAICAEIAAALGGLCVVVEHVGSTAVPGLWAKPIIDIDVVIKGGMFERVADELSKIGYEHVGDQGINGREAFKYEGKEHLMRHHLYVCEEGAAEFLRHIALRDFLRGNEEYRRRYGDIKREMALMHTYDIDKYISGKEPVILEIYGICGL